MANLRNYVEPSVNRYRIETFAHSNADILLLAKLEPQSQQSQRILQGVITAQGDGLEESYIKYVMWN